MSLLSFFEVQTLIADSFPNTEIAVKTQRGRVMRNARRISRRPGQNGKQTQAANQEMITA
jgi:hypothetical protein